MIYNFIIGEKISLAFNGDKVINYTIHDVGVNKYGVGVYVAIITEKYDELSQQLDNGEIDLATAKRPELAILPSRFIEQNILAKEDDKIIIDFITPSGDDLAKAFKGEE